MTKKPHNGATPRRIVKSGESTDPASEMARLFSQNMEGLAGICRAVTDHMSVIDKDHDILWANNVAKRYFGPDIVGKKCHAAYHWANRPCSPCVVDRVFADGCVHEHEIIVAGADGNELTFWCTASPVSFDDDGRPKAVIEVSRDITWRKKTENILRQSEEKYRLIFENAPVGIFYINTSGVITRINPGAAKIMGSRPEDLIGMNLLERLSDQRAIDGLKTALDGKKCHLEGKYTSITGKRTFYCKTDYVSVFLEENKAVGVICVIEDITESTLLSEELKKSREQLRKLSDYIETARERERTRIAREIHDDLGQVLTAVKIDVAWLKKRFSLDAGVEKKALQVMELVDNAIGSVQRITSGLRPPLLNDIGLVAALEWQVKDFAKRMGIRADFKKNCDDTELGEKMSVTLFRICQESLTNIARHSRASAAWVRLSKKRGAIELEIRDNGIGMSDEIMTGDDAFGLMGIRERALTSGGTAKIISAPGKGTRVVVRIPCAVS